MRRYFNPFLIFILLLLAAEIGFRLWDSPLDDEIPDIELDRRVKNSKTGWPEYLSGKKQTDAPFAVLISSSQGYSQEIKEPEKIYFATLKDSMQTIIPDLQMANWSVPGIRTVDLELLTLQAYLREADYIFYVISFGNFDDEQNVRLSYTSNDIHLLAGQPEFWPLEKYTMYGNQCDIEDRVKRLLGLNSKLVRSRNILHNEWGKKIPLEQHLFCFGNYYDMDLQMNDVDLNDIWKVMDKTDLNKKKEKNRMKNFMRIQFRDQPVATPSTFLKFNDNLHDLFEGTDTKIYYVMAPSPLEKFNTSTGLIAEFFEAFETCELREGQFFRFQLNSAVPDEYFQVKGSHFNEEGHVFFASMLFNLIKDGL
jgi:hypothetical protein